MTSCLSGKWTVLINFSLAPQLPHSRIESLSISPIFSALNISINIPPVPGWSEPFGDSPERQVFPRLGAPYARTPRRHAPPDLRPTYEIEAASCSIFDYFTASAVRSRAENRMVTTAPSERKSRPEAAWRFNQAAINAGFDFRRYAQREALCGTLAEVPCGSTTVLTALKRHFRIAPRIGHCQPGSAGLKPATFGHGKIKTIARTVSRVDCLRRRSSVSLCADNPTMRCQ